MMNSRRAQVRHPRNGGAGFPALQQLASWIHPAELVGRNIRLCQQTRSNVDAMNTAPYDQPI